MKDLPYWKFFPSEWLAGNISLLEYDLQGIFIQLCNFYWLRKGDFTFNEAKRRFKDVTDTQWEDLFESGVVKISRAKLIIHFMDEQITEFEKLRESKSAGGKKAMQKRWNKTVTNIEITDLPEPDNNIDKKRKDKTIEEKIKLCDAKSDLFKADVFGTDYSTQIKTNFYNYWSERNKSKTKMKWELQPTWDLPRRLARWSNNSFTQTVPSSSQASDVSDFQEIARQLDADLKDWNTQKEE